MTTEYTYDAQVLKDWFMQRLAALPNVELCFGHKPEAIEQAGDVWRVTAGDRVDEAPFLLNATYAGVNDVHALLGLPPFGIKYEKCEIILCEVDESLKHTGITVMDGAVFQPDAVRPDRPAQPDQRHLHPARDKLRHRRHLPVPGAERRAVQTGQPVQLQRMPGQTGHGLALHEPARAQIPEGRIRFFPTRASLFSMKPILKASEIDDSRPTVVRVLNESPKLVSVLSGKINTVYDLDEVLNV